MKLPDHKCALYLGHNDHRNVYETVEQWLDDRDDLYGWPSAEAMQRAIATDEVWTLQWYPDTPIGFHAIAAPTLGELLEYAATIEKNG